MLLNVVVVEFHLKSQHKQAMAPPFIQLCTGTVVARENTTHESKAAPRFNVIYTMPGPNAHPRAHGAARALALLSARGLEFFGQGYI